MTIRMAVYYPAPADADAFEKRYIEGHLPLVSQYENMRSCSFNKVTRVLAGEFGYAYAFVGTWDDRDGWKADMQSEQAALATKDAQEFATQGFDVVVFEEIA